MPAPLDRDDDQKPTRRLAFYGEFLEVYPHGSAITRNQNPASPGGDVQNVRIGSAIGNDLDVFVGGHHGNRATPFYSDGVAPRPLADVYPAGAWNPMTKQPWDPRVVDAGPSPAAAASVGFPAAAAHEDHYAE